MLHALSKLNVIFQVLKLSLLYIILMCMFGCIFVVVIFAVWILIKIFTEYETIGGWGCRLFNVDFMQMTIDWTQGV